MEHDAKEERQGYSHLLRRRGLGERLLSYSSVRDAHVLGGPVWDQCLGSILLGIGGELSPMWSPHKRKKQVEAPIFLRGTSFTYHRYGDMLRCEAHAFSLRLIAGDPMGEFEIDHCPLCDEYLFANINKMMVEIREYRT